MSLIAALLKWTGLPTWAMELLAIALVSGGVFGAVLWWDHRQIQKGIQEQQQADQIAIQQLQVRADAASATLLKRAQTAEAAYDKEHQANLTPPPITSAIELCNDPHSGSSHLPEAGAAKPGDAATPAPAPVGGPLPARDPAITVDRYRLLAAFAALFDDQSAVIREYQSR